MLEQFLYVTFSSKKGNIEKDLFPPLIHSDKHSVYFTQRELQRSPPTSQTLTLEESTHRAQAQAIRTVSSVYHTNSVHREHLHYNPTPKRNTSGKVTLIWKSVEYLYESVEYFNLCHCLTGKNAGKANHYSFYFRMFV